MFKLNKYAKVIAIFTIAIGVFLTRGCGSGGGGSSEDIGDPVTNLPPETPVTAPATIHPKVGFSVFAIQSDSWDCDGMFRAIDRIEEWHVAILYHTFGTQTECLTRLLSSPKLKSIEFHLINEVCQRHGNCGSHEFLVNISESQWQNRLRANDGQLITDIQNFSFPLAAYLDENMREGVECFISPSLESNMRDDTAITNLIEAVRPVFPRCRLVWNGLNTGTKRFTADYLETHGAGQAPAPCIKNLDGQDINFDQRPSSTGNQLDQDQIQNYFENTRACEFSLLWTVESNCQPPQGGTSQNPRNRYCGDKEFIYNLVADEIIKWQNNNKPPQG